LTTHKRWTRWFILLSLLSLVLVGLTVFTVDPLQHYRRATLYRPLWGNERYYDPGFVRHYDYDCVIIGSSMVQNFIPSEVSKKLSMKVLLAPLNGGTAYEECVLLSTALRTGKVKAVIWGLDMSSFDGGVRRLWHGAGNMPFYLYDDNPFNDYHYLLNIDVLLKDCANALAANLPRRRTNRALDIDSAHFWGNKFRFSREAALKSWRKPEREHRALVVTSKPRLDSMVSSFETNVIPLAERNPGVKYYFFYPPYSILFWISDDVSMLGTHLEFKRYVFKRTRGLQNVKVFDFQDVADITLNLDNYRDWDHHTPDVNKFIIDAISKDEYLVTGDNIEEKISRLEDQARRFADSLDMEEHERDPFGVLAPGPLRKGEEGAEGADKAIDE
jgi:hypothetical protein